MEGTEPETHETFNNNCDTTSYHSRNKYSAKINENRLMEDQRGRRIPILSLRYKYYNHMIKEAYKNKERR